LGQVLGFSSTCDLPEDFSDKKSLILGMREYCQEGKKGKKSLLGKMKQKKKTTPSSSAVSTQCCREF
jgi:hypothetical protein